MGFEIRGQRSRSLANVSMCIGVHVQNVKANVKFLKFQPFCVACKA